MNAKGLISPLVKTIISILSVFFIYRKVISRPDFPEMATQMRETLLQDSNTLPAIVLLLLLPMNWMMETAKWKLLLSKIDPLGWLQALRSVLSGVTVSLFTPNRVGEFAGRVMHLRSGYRIKAAIASVIGSMNQLLITIIAGGLGLIFSLRFLLPDQQVLQYVMMILTTIAIVALLIAFFRMRIISVLSDRYASLRKLGLYTRIFEIYSDDDLMKLTAMSAIRYLVFSVQFWLALGIFGVEIALPDALRLISLIYLVMAVVPTIALSELTVRGSVALYFIAPIAGNSAGILAGTTLVWLVNLVIPAVAGALTVFYFKINR